MRTHHALAVLLSYVSVVLLSSCAAEENPPRVDAPTGDACEASPRSDDPDDFAIAPGVYRMCGTDAADERGDLASLWRIIGNAKFIGLGENVHTSGGFYAFKERAIRALVEDQGVRVLAFESPRTNAQLLEDYLQDASCNSPVKNVLGTAVFTVFADDNLSALAGWLCDWNQAHPDDRVHFFGFDVQQGQTDRELLHATLADFPSAESALAGIAPCATYAELELAEDRTWAYELSDYTECLSGLDALDAWLADNASSFDDETRFELELALLGLRAEQPTIYSSPGSNTAFPMPSTTAEFIDAFNVGTAARDVAMADVFERIVERRFPNERVAVWAHNTHLSKNHDDARQPDGVLPVYYSLTMGTVLGERFPDDWAPIALTAYAPEINWPGIGTGPTDYNTDPAAFVFDWHENESPSLIVDPRAADLGAAPQFLDGELLDVASTYAALVYLDESPGMNALFW